MKLLILVLALSCTLAAGRVIVRDAKSDLIAKATDLVKKADEAVTKLTADKKTHEATVIKAEEAHIQKLITDLTAATEAAAITRLERELGALDARLAHELNRINHTGPAQPATQAPVAPSNPETPSKRDAKSDLIAKATALVTKAEEAVTKLEADKKTHEATVIKTDEAKIKKLIEDLTAATDDAKVKALEHELTLADARLTHEIARATHTGPAQPATQAPANPAKRDAKSDLIAKATDLVKKADEAVTKLTADKKTHEATVIKAEEAHIQKLITDLTAATDAAHITRLERELGALDARLAHELNRINHTGPVQPVTQAPVAPANPETPSKRDAKSDLIAKATDLVKKADEAVTKLTADKKTHEATVIKAEEAHIQKLITDLTAATEAAQITRLERELGALDARLAHELNRINHTGPAQPATQAPVAPANPETPSKRDAKSDLITKATALVTKAEEAATKLEADKKTHEATVIKTEEAKIKKLIEDLTAATDDAKVKSLERELTIADNRLAHEITRATHTGPAQPATQAPTTA